MYAPPDTPMYGAAEPKPNGSKQSFMSHITSPAKFKFKSFRNHRNRLNMVSACQSLWGPWFLFAITFAAACFTIHHSVYALYLVIAIVGFLLVAGLGCFSAAMVIRQPGDDEEVLNRTPTWFVFLFFTCLLAWVLGIVCGNINYSTNMSRYYDLVELNAYPSVDPAYWRGDQVADAGQVMFKEGAYLDVSRSMSFKNTDTYCVAPITSRNETLQTYDFWAVGINCCGTDNQVQFACGDMEVGARGGLRLMDDTPRPYYRLAVQEAEATWHISAQHPIFFYWVADPSARIDAAYDTGLRFFFIGIAAFFALQTFLVVAASLFFAKVGYL